MWTIRHPVPSAALAVVAALAGCTGGGPVAAPAPTVTASSAPVDPGFTGCEAAQVIGRHLDRVSPDDIIAAANAGSRSTNDEFAMKARVLGDFTSAAVLQLETGADRRTVGGRIRGYLEELIRDCQQYGYLPGPAHS